MQLDQKALTQAKKAAATVYMDVDDNLAFDAAIEAGVDAYLSAIPAQSQEPVKAEVAAWRYRYMYGDDVWSEWKPSPIDPNDWTWPATWRDIEVESLYASPAPQVPAQSEGWRPIDTAPKDGTSVLCFAQLDGGGNRTVILRWNREPKFGSRWMTDVLAFVPFTPTHWMPLPASPTGKEGA